MNNITIKFKSVEETKNMLTFLFNNQAILAQFKNDNNNIFSKVNVSFTYALENQVPSEERGLYLNMAISEIAPYLWKLACWISGKSSYREDLAPILYLNDDIFKLVTYPTGRGMEIHINKEGMPIELGIAGAWKFIQRHKKNNEDAFKDLIISWDNYTKTI